jgi:hypothetical protein
VIVIFVVIKHPHRSGLEHFMTTNKVYFGGISGLDDVTNPANIAALVATGTAGLYMHEDAMGAAYEAGQLPAIAAAMSGTVGGTIELGLVSDGVGFFAGWYAEVITANGFRPTEANVNADFTSPTFTRDWTDFVDAAKASGLQTVAPVFSPNVGDLPADGWDGAITAGALLGGALAIDAPPAFFLARGAAYQTFVETEIQWAHQNNLHVNVILSPYQDDATFAADSTQFVSMLSQAGALPDDWSVENYSNDAVQVGSDTQANSVAGVALWVADSAPVYGAASPVAPAGPVTIGSGPDTVSLSVSEDAYLGNAQFTVAVDGRQVGGTQTATALHGSDQSQAFAVSGTFGAGPHVLSIDFLNDAYAGTPTTDRNLYVSNAGYDGVASPSGSATLLGDGTTSLTVGAPDLLALDVSEDAYQGNAEFTVSVDGTQVGGIDVATAAHAAGQSQLLDLAGDWGPGSHVVTVQFINDRYDGTTATDRNLYVTGAAYDGAPQSVSLAEYGDGPASFSVVSASLYTPGATGGTIVTQGNDTVQAGSGALMVVGQGPSADVVGGSGSLAFIAKAGNDTVTGGSGDMTITGGSGSLSVVAGRGNVTIDAGSGHGQLTVTNGQAGGTLTITDFRAGLDTLHLAGFSANPVVSTGMVDGSLRVHLSDSTTIDLVGLSSVNTAHLFS